MTDNITGKRPDGPDVLTPPERWPYTRRPFHAQDGGFTSVGVVVALLLTVALLFTAAQVHWINSTSADIQFAADSGALAGENATAEYMVVVRMADAVVLSMSLFGITVLGITVVISCVPGCQGVGVKMADFARQVFKARDKLADQATSALNKLQKALPFLMALNASSAISANKFSKDGQESYMGIAIPVPVSGVNVAFADDAEARSATEGIEDKNSETAEYTDAAEDARKEMEDSKHKAWLADCGDDPNYCMYERASKLASLGGSQNPYFASESTWRFDYAFSRAKAYYDRRLATEAPGGTSLTEQTRSFVRTRLYTYAVQLMQTGWCHTYDDGTLDAYFPLLPRNANEIRSTSLYTEEVYPISGDDVMHGSPSCPAVASRGAVAYGSVKQLESDVYSVCATCDFSVKNIANVASASSNISNGFEYHYRIVAKEAERYGKAAKEYKGQTDAAKSKANEAFDMFKTALSKLGGKRLTAQPPGRFGCIAIALDTSEHDVPGIFSSTLIGGGARLSTRAAISAAALVQDEPAEGANIISSFLDGVKADVGGQGVGTGALGAFDGVMDIWGNMLLAYSTGADSIASGVADFLNSIPIVKSTPLGNWAKGALDDIIKTSGLEGADMSTPKPVIVNTLHVARQTDNGAGQLLVRAKEAYSSYPGSGSGSFVDMATDLMFSGFDDSDIGTLLQDGTVTVFTISFGDIPGIPEIPVNITLPGDVARGGRNVVDEIRSGIGSALGGGGDNAIWE